MDMDADVTAMAVLSRLGGSLKLLITPVGATAAGPLNNACIAACVDFGDGTVAVIANESNKQQRI